MDLEKALLQELAGINVYLKGLGECELDGICGELVFDKGMLKGHLQVKRGSSAGRYYYEFADKDGNRRTVAFGGSMDPRVIRFKQFKYNEVLRAVLKRNKKLLERILKTLEKSHFRYDPEAIDSLLTPVNVDRTGLVNKCPGLISPDDWMNIPFETYARGSDENKKHITCDGTRVRSKGEVIIYNTLKMLGVPFRYEQTIILTDENGARVRRVPDFVILRPDGTEVILEYLGKIDDDEYLLENLRKIQLYRRNGYDLGRNLFLMGDSYGGWIDSQQIVKLVEFIMS